MTARLRSGPAARGGAVALAGADADSSVTVGAVPVRLLAPPRRWRQARRVLAVRTDHLGNLLMTTPALDLAGRTSLWELGAQVVCNDTGTSYIAAALGTPSVVVANGSDVERRAPANAQRHRVLWHDLPCRPCAHRHCPHDMACARAIAPQAVLQQAMRWLPAPAAAPAGAARTREAVS